MILPIVLATLISIQDPSGDTVGAGDLNPPTTAIFRNMDAFDALAFSVEKASTFGFDLKLADVSNPWQLAYGFSLPIIEVYVKLGPGESRENLLTGSGMRLEGGSWNYVFKITGDHFQVYSPRADELIDVTEVIGANLSLEDNLLKIRSNLKLSGSLSVYAMIGSYDPFSPSGWRSIQASPSAWALSSANQDRPVIDVIADSFSLQEKALSSGVLPEVRAGAKSLNWLWLVFLGLMVASFGLIERFRLPSLGKASARASNMADNTFDTTAEDDPASHTALLPSPLHLEEMTQAIATNFREQEKTLEPEQNKKKLKPFSWTQWDEVPQDILTPFQLEANKAMTASAPAMVTPVIGGTQAKRQRNHQQKNTENKDNVIKANNAAKEFGLASETPMAREIQEPNPTEKIFEEIFEEDMPDPFKSAVETLVMEGARANTLHHPFPKTAANNLETILDPNALKNLEAFKAQPQPSEGQTDELERLSKALFNPEVISSKIPEKDLHGFKLKKDRS
ncbi:MAG: glucodextranase DOMON-like domain-containing protein [Deinococcales bacterium]